VDILGIYYEYNLYRSFAYPDSNANSLRVDGVVRILENLGHMSLSVRFVSGTKNRS
jgi:hypothetical protein